MFLFCFFKFNISLYLTILFKIIINIVQTLQVKTACDFGLSSILTDKLSSYITDIADCDDYKMYASVKDVILE